MGGAKFEGKMILTPLVLQFEVLVGLVIAASGSEGDRTKSPSSSVLYMFGYHPNFFS